jgi:C1A family cysteine protease
MSNLEHALGLVLDPPDPRDFLWGALVSRRAAKLPASYRWRTCGPVLNQGSLPHCVAFSTATLKMVDEWKESGEAKTWHAFETEWLYKRCKELDGKPRGRGTNLRTALKIVKDEGYPARGTFVRARHREGPGRSFKLKSYVKLESLREIKEAVKVVGPVAIGIRVDEGIHKPLNGVLPPPTGKAKDGHAMVVTGWDDTLGALRLKNSWGYRWGDKGFAWMPYDHLEAYRWNAWKAVDLVELQR